MSTTRAEKAAPTLITEAENRAKLSELAAVELPALRASALKAVTRYEVWSQAEREKYLAENPEARIDQEALARREQDPIHLMWEDPNPWVTIKAIYPSGEIVEVGYPYNFTKQTPEYQAGTTITVEMGSLDHRFNGTKKPTLTSKRYTEPMGRPRYGNPAGPSSPVWARSADADDVRNYTEILEDIATNPEIRFER